MLRLEAIMKICSRILLVGCLHLMVSPAAAQYMFLDSNGDGVYQSTDGELNYPASTLVDVWLRTDVGRDGLADPCPNDGSIPLTIHQYNVFISVVTATQVVWNQWTNNMTGFS